MNTGRFFLLLSLLLTSQTSLGQENLSLAVASNFATAIAPLAVAFEQRSGHRVHISLGSTGRHYAQIRNGAPYDLFLAADAERPMLLERNGVAIANSRFTYALGQLAIWQPSANKTPTLQALLSARKIAIANPGLAPYGKAAEECIAAAGLSENTQHKWVRGENVAQALQFVATGNASIGLVALSQVLNKPAQQWRRLGPECHAPIRQQAVLLNHRKITADFKTFLLSQSAQSIIRETGYLAAEQ